MSNLRDILDRLRGEGSGSKTSSAPVAPGKGADTLLANLRGSAGYDYGDSHLGATRSRVAAGQLGFAEEGFRIRDEEDKRHDEALGFLTDQNEQSLQPTLTDQDINDLFASQVDQADQAGEENASSLRSMLGGAGITGGGQAAAFATRINNARIGQVIGAKRDMRGLRAQLDAETNMRRFSQGVQLAGFMAQGPSDTGLGVMGELLGVSLTREANEQGVITAREQSDAMKSAAEKEMWGNIGGGVLGLAGGIFG